MNLALFFIYRYFVVPVGFIALPFAAVFNSKIRKGLGLRIRARGKWSPPERPLWIHASSGEFEYAKAVIRECKARDPSIPVMVTYFSPSYAKQVQSFSGVDFSLPLPLDLPGPMRSFLRKYEPRALLIARTDLWPELLWQCRCRKVPIVLFSYTQAPIAPRRVLKRLMKRWLLNWIDEVDCVSPDDLEAVRELGIQAAEVIGDTRYDQVEFRLENSPALPAVLIDETPAPLLVAGSTWPQDEERIIPALAEILKSGRLKLILVPHEPDPRHIEALEKQLQKFALSWQRSSARQPWIDQQVLLVDETGILAELYKGAELAFVGGSFRASVHSVMEPLGAGCLTLVGPHFQNNREAVQFAGIAVGNFNAVEPVQSEAELTTQVERRLENLSALESARQQLKTEFHTRLGASRRLLDRISSLVEL